MFVALEGTGPLYQRLYRGLRSAIIAGRLQPLARLPSTRALAAELGLSRNVVIAAFEQLLAEGYVNGRTGSGTYVSSSLMNHAPMPASIRADASERSPAQVALSRCARRLLELQPFPPAGRPPGSPQAYDFRYGRPSLRDFPQAIWTRLLAYHARTLSTHTLDYTGPSGSVALRKQLAAYLRRARGVDVTPGRIMIVAGTQQAIDLVTRLLINAGDRVAIEEPSYRLARHAMQTAGARMVPVPVDADGLVVAKLPRRGIALAYVTPSHQFPLGGIMPLARRLELVRWARQCGAYVLEDDYDSEFRYDARPVEAVQSLDRDARVIYMGTFSKVMFPALRIGYLVLPEELVDVAMGLKLLTDFHAPSFEQEVLATFLADGHFDRHLRRMRTLYGTRRAVMLASIEEHLGDRVTIAGASAGLHVVAWLNGITASSIPSLIEHAATRGVNAYPLAPHYLHPPRRGALLLGYASLADREIRAGIQILAGVLPRRIRGRAM